MRNYFVKILLSFIGISYAMFVNAQDSIVGRILDEQEQGLDAAVVMLASLPDNVLIETTITDSDGKEVPAESVEVVVKVTSNGIEDTVYKKSHKKDTEKITVPVEGVGTITVKIFLDGVRNTQKQLDLNSSNPVLNID